MNRFYTTFTVEKAMDDDGDRIIEGIASTNDVDRVGDIVEPEGVVVRGHLPLLWQHDSYQPIGSVEKWTATKKGIKFRARIAKVDGPPLLKNRLDEAWASVKSGLIRAVSIGFRAIERAYMEGDGIHFQKWEWVELSLVTVPAQPYATINEIRAYHDERGKTAAHARRSVAITPAVVSAKSSTSIQRKADMKIAEQIKTLEDEIARKQATRVAIQEKASTEGRNKDQAEKDQFDRLGDDIKALKEELADLKDLEATELTKSAPVEAKTAAQASQSRAEPRIVVNNQRAEKGIGFAQSIMCLATSKMAGISAVDLAKEHYSYDERVAMLCKGIAMKAAVPGGVPTSSAWAGAIANPQDLVTEFVEFARAGSIVGKLSKVRRVGFNYKVSRQTGAGTAAWVGAGLPTPATKPGFDQITIGKTSLSGLAYIAKSNLRFANIDAERAVRDDLSKDVRTLLDTDFVDPANAGTANIKPASITNGLTPITPSGTDGDAATLDLKNVLQAIVNANLSLDEVSWIMRGDMALGLSTLKNALGQKEFPELTPMGGTLLGLPCIVSNSVKPGDIIAAHEGSIYLATDNDVTIEMSGDASIEALDGSLQQDGTVGTGAAMVSMFQTRMFAFLAELYANWVVSRTNAVACITAGNYNGTPTA